MSALPSYRGPKEFCYVCQLSSQGELKTSGVYVCDFPVRSVEKVLKQAYPWVRCGRVLCCQHAKPGPAVGEHRCPEDSEGSAVALAL
jgi:hypothetical protein